MRAIYNWKEIQAYHDQGHGFVASRQRFGIAHATWVKAIRRGDIIVRPQRTKSGRLVTYDGSSQRVIYDWAAVQAYYDEGHSARQCMAKFGLCSASWHKARMRGRVQTRPAAMPLNESFRRGVSRYNVKARLLRAGLLENRCSHCGLDAWRGKPLTLHIDHINGIRHDHRLENLRMLCPNCHSQTPTYGGKNIKRKRRLQEGSVVV